jgi:hypothetical protein
MALRSPGDRKAGYDLKRARLLRTFLIAKA